jgi:hypothetical protein
METKEAKWSELYQLVLDSKEAAEELAKTILQNVVINHIVCENPIVGFKKPTRFRKWLFDVLREAEEKNKYLQIGGWVLYEAISCKTKFSEPPMPKPEGGWKPIDLKKNYGLASFLTQQSTELIKPPAGWLDRFAYAYIEQMVFNQKPLNRDYALIVAAGVELALKPGVVKHLYDMYAYMDEVEKTTYETIFLLTQVPDLYKVVAELLTEED